MVNATLLVYSAAVVPLQLSLWERKLCQPVPTLYFDIIVDSFFLVKLCLELCCANLMGSALKACFDYRWILQPTFLSDITLMEHITTS